MDPQSIRYNLIEMLLRDERYNPTTDLEEIISLAEKYTRYIVDTVEAEDEIIHIECPSYLSNRLNK
jgi:hypothetical protein